MKDRQQPKIFLEEKIYSDKQKRNPIGYIKLVQYLTGEAIPHVEYKLDEDHHGKGIMSKEFPKYLKLCKKYEFTRLIANVKADNVPSIRILEKNGFLKFGTISDDSLIYITDLKLTDSVRAFHKHVLSNVNFCLRT